MLSTFVYINGLQEVDVIIAKKRQWGIFDHFIIYMGKRFGKHFFIANDARGGVRWFTELDVVDLIKDFDPTKIRKFNGDLRGRQLALARAEAEVGKSYSLVDFNCEHLANYVQYGIRESKQVENWKVGLTVASGLLLAAFIFGD